MLEDFEKILHCIKASKKIMPNKLNIMHCFSTGKKYLPCFLFIGGEKTLDQIFHPPPPPPPPPTQKNQWFSPYFVFVLTNATLFLRNMSILAVCVEKYVYVQAINFGVFIWAKGKGFCFVHICKIGHWLRICSQDTHTTCLWLYTSCGVMASSKY